MQQQKKCLPFIAMLFGALLLWSNITAQKLTTIFNFTMPASIIIYPVLYTMGSLITEVYGKRTALRITFYAIVLNLLMALTFSLAILLPAASIYTEESSYNLILGSTPLFILASFISFFTGEVTNIVLTVLIKKTIKLSLRLRTLICNLAGLSIDCFIFILISFFHLSFSSLIHIALAYYFFKVIYQLILTIFIKPLVQLVRRLEA